jgi:hypothetical protein
VVPLEAYGDTLREGQRAPIHAALGIIDRVTRTIRDMAFRSGYRLITPPVMDFLVDAYNRVPHDTLSKIMSEIRSGVTLTQCQSDEILQKEIQLRLMASNQTVLNEEDWRIPDGTLVVVKNPRDIMTKRRLSIRVEGESPSTRQPRIGISDRKIPF